MTTEQQKRRQKKRKRDKRLRGKKPDDVAAAAKDDVIPAVMTTEEQQRNRNRNRRNRRKGKKSDGVSAAAKDDVITAATTTEEQQRTRDNSGRGKKSDDVSAAAKGDVFTAETTTEEQQQNRKRKRGNRGRGKKSDDFAAPAKDDVHSVSLPSASKRGSESSSAFLDKMKAKLSGGYFRMINEKLYTCTGDEALSYFTEDPSLFNVYHSGYQEQMSHWPEQPNDIIIKWINNESPSFIIADFGCGDARLSKSVKNKVHSFDLVAHDPSVIACDMSKTPLDDASVDVAVFCLSLMGTNFPKYLLEANRVLKPRGWLLIAEVKSRFDPSTGGAEPEKFVKAISELGFTNLSRDFSNKMFILFYFKKKEKQNPKDITWPELKPCLYKRR